MDFLSLKFLLFIILGLLLVWKNRSLATFMNNTQRATYGRLLHHPEWFDVGWTYKFLRFVFILGGSAIALGALFFLLASLTGHVN